MNKYWSDGTELYHYGILGMKWGIRRFQNPDGTLTEEGKLRYQKKEYNIARKSQTSRYRGDYDRVLDYKNASQTVQERAKELKSLSNRAWELSMKLEDYTDNSKVQAEAYSRALNLARKNPSFDQSDPNAELKYNDRLVSYYLYDKNILDKTAKEMLSKDSKYTALRKEYSNTIKQYKQTCRRIADDIIGSYGNAKILGLGTNMTYKELVYAALTEHGHPPTFTWEDRIGRR